MYKRSFFIFLILGNVLGCDLINPCGGVTREEFIPNNILVEVIPTNKNISPSDFKIHLFLVIDHISTLSIPTFIPLTSIAYACSPPPPISKHKVEEVSITSSSNFNNNLLAGNNLSHIFTVDVFTGNVFETLTVKEYFDTNPQISDQITFKLTESPSLKQHNFTVKLTFVDDSAYESSTGIINFE